MTEIVDIVNERDEVIGQMERDDTKQNDTIFRSIFILFYTPDKRVILQLRSMAKKSHPGKLTTTVSGHVISGATYDETAIKEAHEESGIEIDQTKLHSLGVIFLNPNMLEKHGIKNAAGIMRALYAYPYDGDIADLKVEDGEGAGFVTMSIDQLRKQRIKTPEKFTPSILSDAGTKLIDYIEHI
ncbi:MAG: Nudix hydrolase [Candidatus Saccharibacteria bacterium]|nr:Nudix hydrolase [Candidatus Saccharibacteria bacterium]